MAALALASIEIHKEWIAQASVQELSNPNGGLKLYRHRQTFLRDHLERELMDRCGIQHSLLDAEQVAELEPDLKRIFVQGVLIDQTISIRDPEKLCKAYAQMFVEAGGQVRQAAAQSLRQAADGWELTTDQGVETVSRIVVCMGAWTPAIIAPLGYPNPLAIERGYHTIFSPTAEAGLSRPIFDVDASYVMSPMQMGLRVSSGSNLVHRETEPDPRQLARVIPKVREAFPVDRVLLDEPWMGRRPSLPDTLPIIGPAPRHDNLWFAFGHAHMGFTLGPITGRLIANLVSGSDQPFSPAACDPGRYL